MNEVTLHANATVRPLDNGLEVVVTGDGRTLQAIKRMVPAHVSELVKLGWDAKTEEMPNGVKLTVTTSDVKQVAKLKALGFMGIMVQGAHHQMHHLMMAKGEHVH
jgi:predicted RNA binding protein YcfA (HicA-like mRNA interferase family)